MFESNSFFKSVKNAFQFLVKKEGRALLLCFSIAIIFWFFHSLNDTHTANLKIPVQYNYTQANVVPLRPPPEKITLNVTGIGWGIFTRSLGIKQNKLEVDLPKPTEVKAISVKSILPDISEVVKEFTLNFVIEDSLKFEYDSIVEKPIEIYLDSSNFKLKQSYIVEGSIQLFPDKIKSRGPSKILSEITDKITLKLEASGVDRDFEKTIEIPNSNKDWVEFFPSSVKVLVNVIKMLTIRKNVEPVIKNIPKKVNLNKLKIFPELAYVKFELLETQKDLGDSIKVILDFDEFNENDSTICPKYIAPSELQEVVILPGHFKVSY